MCAFHLGCDASVDPSPASVSHCLVALGSTMAVPKNVADLMDEINKLSTPDFDCICEQIDKARKERKMNVIMVTVSQLDGTHLLGPELMPASTSAGQLSNRFSRVQPNEVMEFVVGTTFLQPTDTLASLGEEFKGTLYLVRRPERMKIEPHRRMRGLFVASLTLGTSDILVVPGGACFAHETVYQPGLDQGRAELEELQVPEVTFRSWNPFCSYIAAAIVNGISAAPKWKDARVLAVGLPALELTYLSDLVGKGGAVVRTRSEPLEAGAVGKLRQHWPNVQELVDLPDDIGRFHALLIHGDVEASQPVLDNVKTLLFPGAVVMWSREIAPGPGSKYPEEEFARTVQSMKQAGLRPKEQVTLEPFFHGSALIVSGTGKDWPA